MTDAGTRGAQQPSWSLTVLHLVALTSFAVAQPLFDLLGRNPEFFVARGSTTSDIVVLALAVVLIPAAAVVAIAAVARLAGDRGARAVVVGLIGVLATVTVLPVAKRALLDSPRQALAVACVAGLLVAALYLRTAAMRLFATFLAPAPLFFLVLFLFVSPTSRLVLPQGAKGHAITSRVRATAPIVMIVGDEFATGALMGRDHLIDAKRFPNLAALGDESTWYRNSTTVHDNTHLAVPAILTGTRSKGSALPTAIDHPDNLFRWLSTGYELNVHEAITQVCPEEVCGGSGTTTSFVSRFRLLAEDSGVAYLHSVVPRQWTRSLPSIDQGWGGFIATHQTQSRDDVLGFKKRNESLDQQTRFDAFVDSLHRSSRPTLNFLHVLMPHVPLNRLPRGEPVLGAGLTPGLDRDTGKWTKGTDYVITLQLQRYLLYLENFDREIGRVIEKLRALDLYDDALIVVTADHGVGFVPGLSRRTLVAGNASDILPQPLIIKAPRQRKGRVDDRNVQSVDVLPTIADLLDERLPFRTEGRSARSKSMATTKLAKGAAHTLRIPADFPTRYRITDLVASLLSHRDDQFDIYAQGPHADLAGRPIDSLSHRAPVNRDLVVNNLGQIRLPDRDVGLPVLINGTIEETAGTTVVVALNGTVAGIGETFVEDGTTKYAVLVPPGLFEPSGNDVHVYLLGADRALTEVTG